MENDRLTSEERQTLLRLAREALEQALCEEPRRGLDLAAPLPQLWRPLDLALLTPRLRGNGASFVTLTSAGSLRGCMGALEAYQPLAEDVREHAIAAGLEDPRFPPVASIELPGIRIEVSRLTQPILLEYSTCEDLLHKLRPHRDGVIFRDGYRRATFLPQVWEKIPDPADFLDELCYKMGSEPGLWRRNHLDVHIYEVEEFHE